MKKLLAIVLSAASLFCFGAFAAGCDDGSTIYVQTNAFFAPFEYYDDTGKIVGVDVDIMNRVGEKMGRKVKFTNGDFGQIIQLVHEGKTADVGAAGITITDERKEMVEFSIPYYTAVQYVIWDAADTSIEVSKNTDGEDVVLWSELQGKVIGVQTDTTGNIYVNLEINALGDDHDDTYEGALEGSGAICRPYPNAQLAVEAMYAGGTDTQIPTCVVVDEMPATYLSENMVGRNLRCAPLYYDAETATEEQYAICVTPGKTEILDAINEVLEEMLASGEIDRLVSEHLGLGK